MDSLFSSGALSFYRNLQVPKDLPQGVSTLFPFSNDVVWKLNERFYSRFYSDTKPRTYLIGIIPGRLGAGITGIPFTDPIRLESVLKIKNSLDKKAELSSKFIYDVIDSLGGAKEFFSKFYISSVSPIGFVKKGKNLNYYDQKDLENSLKEYITNNLKIQLETLPSNRERAFCLGMGKNFKFLQKLNQEENFFKEIIPLPHPRWVMQYRLKSKDEFILEYQSKLGAELGESV